MGVGSSPPYRHRSLPGLKHYTEEPSRLTLSRSAAFVRVHGGGFVTREMLDATVEELRTGAAEARLDAVLVDLRMVAGYETACLLPVRQFLREAPTLGVRRIAVVATSSVLRTASRLAAHKVEVELRTFEQERTALQWLHPGGSHMTGSHSTGSHSTGPHSTGSHSTGPHSTGSTGAGVITARSHASSASVAAVPS